ncbi:DUF3466 family protein [Actinomadura geliboluensis]|uniref:DUF3466 family protein n=1 Tax=Actinomadura geliboluensis TaxID=882440 RepID=UPI0036C1704D
MSISTLLRRSVTAAAATALAAAAVTVPAHAAEQATTYTYVDLGSVPGYASSVANDVNAGGVVVGSADKAVVWQDGEIGRLPMNTALGVNDAGRIVGSAYTGASNEPAHAVVYRDGELVDLGAPYGGANGSTALAINESDTVAGAFRESGQPTRAAVWDADGTMHRLPGLGGVSYGTESQAAAINEGGQVVGTAVTKSGANRAVIWENGTVRDLGTLGGGGYPGTRALDVNDQGTVVGDSQKLTGYMHAVSWSNGKITDLGTLGGPASFAGGINNRGQIVGISDTDSSGGAGRRAFIWENGKMTDLNKVTVNLPTGTVLYNATAINDDGVIVGTASPRAFMLVPND